MTIENLGLNVSITAYGYNTNNFQLIIIERSIIIHNSGPHNVRLRESEIEITVDNNTYVKFPLQDSITIKAGGSYQFVLAPPELIVENEEQFIYDSIMDYFIETETILYSDVIVGGREYSIKKGYFHPLVFLSLPTDVRP
jgi:hypothetical protein